ncbi:MAG TPA: hypothetical protein VGD69_27625 [Herpetosiphonaceae bacterium]
MRKPEQAIQGMKDRCRSAGMATPSMADPHAEEEAASDVTPLTVPLDRMLALHAIITKEAARHPSRGLTSAKQMMERLLVQPEVKAS